LVFFAGFRRRDLPWFSSAVRHTSSAYLTFVALDERGQPVAIPPVIPETEDEKRRYEEAAQRRDYRLEMRQKGK